MQNTTFSIVIPKHPRLQDGINKHNPEHGQVELVSTSKLEIKIDSEKQLRNDRIMFQNQDKAELVAASKT